MQNTLQQNSMSRYLTVTNVLIAICVLIYFLQSQTGRLNGELYFWKNSNFEPWQVLSHMFMHGSVNHLLFNMFGLWMFGSVLERVWGAKRFLFFYLACGIGAAIIYLSIKHYQFDNLLEQIAAAGISQQDAMNMFSEGKYMPNLPITGEAVRLFATPMVGASGAIYGVLVAFAFLFPNHKLMLIFLPVPIAAKYFVPAILGLDLFSGVTGFSLFGGNVAHFAHIGGAVIGAILTYLWYQQIKAQRNAKLSQQMGIWRE